MGRDSLIRRLKRSAGRHAMDGGLAVLFVIALAVGAPAALSGFGKFAEAITPSIAAQASDRVAAANNRRLPITGSSASLSAAARMPVSVASDSARPAMPRTESVTVRDGGLPVIAICIDDLGPDPASTRKPWGCLKK